MATYLFLSRVDTIDSSWRDWLDNKGESEEVILDIYISPEGAYEGIKAAIDQDDSKGYALQAYCDCCGKRANQQTIWYDPEQKQLFGVV